MALLNNYFFYYKQNHKNKNAYTEFVKLGDGTSEGRIINRLTKDNIYSYLKELKRQCLITFSIKNC